MRIDAISLFYCVVYLFHIYGSSVGCGCLLLISLLLLAVVG